MKGLDYLAPQGFHGAIRAYGLPEEIIITVYGPMHNSNSIWSIGSDYGKWRHKTGRTIIPTKGHNDNEPQTLMVG